MTFEYDPRKAKTNWQKLGVSFAEAEMVFFHPFAIHDFDPVRSPVGWVEPHLWITSYLPSEDGETQHPPP